MNQIENTLYELYFAAEFNYQTADQKRAQVDAYRSIEWYVNTCRASAQWCKALAKAKPITLLKHILKSDDQSVDGQIAATTKYLARYCGL